MAMRTLTAGLFAALLWVATCWPAAAEDEVARQRMPLPSRWVSADGAPRRPHPLPPHRGPVVARLLESRAPTRSAGTPDAQSRGRICIVVSDSAYEGIAPALDVYRRDLEADGYEVIAYELVSGAAEPLRDLMKALYHEPASLVGAVFIGGVPYVIYELMQSFDDEPPVHEDFPCDLFFMDLDGVWEDVVEEGGVHAGNGKYDLHTGETGLEIWICRIAADGLPALGAEADVLRNYFAKDHLYGLGGMPVERRALLYLDDAWAGMADDDRDCAARLYPAAAIEVVDEPEVTTRSDYLGRLAIQGYELLHTRCHGDATSHDYARADGQIREIVTSSDYVLYDPRVLFYSFFICGAADYTASGYLAGTAVLNQSWGLLAWGTTKTGGMFNDGPFYESLAWGASFGEAFLTWSQSMRQRYSPAFVQKWWYGMVLIGDATLTHRSFSDVGRACWGAAEISACADAGIVGGYEDGTYRPHASVSRDQMAAYVSRAIAGGAERVPPGPPDPSFTDVGTDHWAFDCVEYAAENRIVEGYRDGSYRPELPVDRGQMAVFVARSMVAPAGEAAFADYVPADPKDFPDVPADFWAWKHVEYSVEHGVVQGYGDGYYRPEITVTRDQMAVYVARAFGLVR